MNQTATFEEPKFARFLFASPAAAWIWLVARVWLGYQWLHAGWEKVTGTESGWHLAFTHDSWLRTSAGLKGFAGFALTNAKGPHAARTTPAPSAAARCPSCRRDTPRGPPGPPWVRDLARRCSAIVFPPSACHTWQRFAPINVAPGCLPAGALTCPSHRAARCAPRPRPRPCRAAARLPLPGDGVEPGHCDAGRGADAG